MSERRPDVIVVGGGIVGAAAAAFLADGGARVTIVEREGLASGASGANSGVVQHPFDPILASLYRETVDLYRDLSALDLGFRLGDEPVGLLYASTDETAVRGVDLALAEAFPELPRDVVGGTTLQRLEPALAPGLWACRVGIGYPVQPGASTYAYATLAERRGVTIRQGRAATLDVRGDTVVGVIVDGRPVTADAVLVAAGPWSSAAHRPDRRLAADPRALGRRRRAGAAGRTDPRPRGGRDRRGHRHAGARGRPRPGRLQPRAAGRHRVGRVDVPARRSPTRPPGSSRSCAGQPRSSRASPTLRSAGRARAPGRRAPTGDRSSAGSRAGAGWSCAPATGRGGSRPGPPRRDWPRT